MIDLGCYAIIDIEQFPDIREDPELKNGFYNSIYYKKFLENYDIIVEYCRSKRNSDEL